MKAYLSPYLLSWKAKKIVMGEVYQVPGSNIRTFMEEYGHIVNTISNESKSAVIGNIDLLRARDHLPTADFVNLNHSYGLIPITRPTRVTYNSATLIDNLYMTVNDCIRIKSRIIHCGISDHFSILLLKIKGPLLLRKNLYDSKHAS